MKEDPRLNCVDNPIECNESVWIEIYVTHNDKLLMGCIYRSPNSDRVM